jgi:hypothetical protein
MATTNSTHANLRLKRFNSSTIYAYRIQVHSLQIANVLLLELCYQYRIMNTNNSIDGNNKLVMPKVIVAGDGLLVLKKDSFGFGHLLLTKVIFSDDGLVRNFVCTSLTLISQQVIDRDCCVWIIDSCLGLSSLDS